MAQEVFHAWLLDASEVKLNTAKETISAGRYQVPGINTANTRFQDGGIEY